MRDWQDRCQGAELIGDGLIVNESPDEEAQNTCRELGNKLANW
jgi:hypothetical protein